MGRQATSAVVDAAAGAARRAALTAGVSVAEAEGIDTLREVSRLLESVWGRSDEGVPLTSEAMRALVHAGGCVTVAVDRAGALAGAAVLAPAAPAGSAYSLIAAVDPGGRDRGIGLAVKQRQRLWALRRGLSSVAWTFDPLVARNARFNLVRLGAEAREYVVGFYGEMADDINGSDESDRLVACWRLDSDRAARAAAGDAPTLDGPAPAAEALAEGPDGMTMLRRDGTGLWLRVPEDVVALRRSDPPQAARWRVAAREVLLGALAEGRVAEHLTRSGWYLLRKDDA